MHINPGEKKKAYGLYYILIVFYIMGALMCGKQII